MTQTSHPNIRTFNPGTFQSDAEIIDQFVVREHELAIVLEVLRGNVDADSCQHTLIVAPRGRGKTMLLARVAAELRTNPGLSNHLLPIRFMEESHEVFSAADFWLEVLFYLSRETSTQDPELAGNLRETHADLTTRWRERELDERARGAVLEVADRLGKRLVLMVENLQGLCDNVDEHFGWSLRKTLQSEPEIILLASATSRFEGLDDAQDPFFELFRIISLQPLDTEQCRRLWQAVSGHPVSARRVRALQILTGGDPRLLVIVAEFQRHGSIRQLMEQLVQMIDDHTEYFRGHLETLGKTERRVYLALMDLWEPSTTGEISSRARLDIRTVSTMLGRLVHRGAVEPRNAHRRYAVAQRLYSIYYKLRRERDEAVIVQKLLHFMDVFYRDNETTELYAALHLDALQSPMILEGIERVRLDIPQLDDIVSGIARDAQALNDATIERIEHGDYSSAIAACDDLIARFGASEATELQVQVIRALINKGVAFDRIGEHPAAIDSFRTAVERFRTNDAPELQHRIAVALLNMGVVQTRSGDHSAAIEAYDELIQRFQTNPDAELQTLTARALVDKGHLQGRMGDHAAEIDAYRTVVERYGNSEVPDLQVEVAEALDYMGVALERHGQHRAAIAARDTVIARYGASDAPELEHRVARALINRGVEQAELGEYSAALATLDTVAARYAGRAEPELQEMVARSLVFKAATQHQLDDADGAIATCDYVLSNYGQREDPGLRAPIAGALLVRGEALAASDRHDEAIATADDLIARFTLTDDPELQHILARTMKNKTESQRVIGDFDAALATSARIVDHFGGSRAPELRIQVQDALFRKGMIQTKIGRADEALRTSDEFERWIDEPVSGPRSPYAWKPACIKVFALIAQGDGAAATESLCSMYAALDPEDEMVVPHMVEGVARLATAGVPERELAAVLSLEPDKAAALAPLMVALRQRAGETVHAPAEVLEVAADVRKRIDEIATSVRASAYSLSAAQSDERMLAIDTS